MKESSIDALAVLAKVWPEECALAGDSLLHELVESPEGFGAPAVGQHFDLTPVLQILVPCLSLVASVFSIARNLPKGKTKNEMKREVIRRLAEEERRQDDAIPAAKVAQVISVAVEIIVNTQQTID
jgi:hypothetical protein